MAEMVSVEGEPNSNLERRVKRLSHFVSEKVKTLGTMDFPLLRLLHTPSMKECKIILKLSLHIAHSFLP